MMRMTVDVLRMNRNVWLAAFTGMTQAQVSSALSVLDTDFSDISRTFQTFTATSYPDGYFVVQLDRTGNPIPGGIKDMLVKAVNNVYAGVI